MYKLPLSIFGFVVLSLQVVQAQSYIENPSFEGETGLHFSPPGWEPCKENSTPDTGPVFSGAGPASHGESYLHMVTRASNHPYPYTTEACQTKLLIPLIAGKCYRFSLDLSLSLATQTTAENGFVIKYDMPSILRVWGGDFSCDRREVLWESKAIDHSTWERYNAILHPKEGNIDYLIFEVDYAGYASFGNICLDNVQLAAIPEEEIKLQLTITKGDEVELQAGVGNSYVWEPTEGLSCTDCPNPIAAPEKSTLYSVTIITEDSCVYKELYMLHIKTKVFVANIFSPNGDGNNDAVFVHINGNEVTSMEFLVYDRWGQQVFKTTDPSMGWDGTFAGNSPMPGVYAYTVNFTTAAKENIVKTGNITLVK